MKKILLFLALPLVFLSTVPAQVTQNEADTIVLERIGEMEHCDALYAMETLQTEGTTITTSSGETLELDYSCWVYYMNYAGETNNKYLIVKESNGNLLQINTTNDGGPEDLAAWRVVLGEVLFDVPVVILSEDYPDYTHCPPSWPCWEGFQGNSFELLIINNHEELEQYITCTDYPEIDFSEKTLLVARGNYRVVVWITHHSLQQSSTHSYIMNVRFRESIAQAESHWAMPIIVNKITDCDSVELNVTYTFGP